MNQFDVVIIGAGGAGLMCAIHAGRRGLKTLVVDHSEKVGGKILISGGGRCNFTNQHTTPANYQSQNEHFSKSALSRYTPQDFISMVKDHHIPFHEKKLGQLFCDKSAKDIVEMLIKESQKSQVQLQLSTQIQSVSKVDTLFTITTSKGSFQTHQFVVATGGYSIPRMGATGFGFEIAKQFGLSIVETAPALDGFILTDPQTKIFCELAGLSLDCIMTAGDLSFRENLLFTHVGISGPAALQASLHWRPGQSIQINLLPDMNFLEFARQKKQSTPKTSLKNMIASFFPSRFADLFIEQYIPKNTQLLAETSDTILQQIHQLLHSWTLKPSSTVGYAKAEVTRGGVDTNELSSKTMEAKKVPGLYFIGEVVDVTGWLGGFNFQWAWASGWCAAQAFHLPSNTKKA